MFWFRFHWKIQSIFSIDTYESHAGILYCKHHFKSLFSPKAVEDNEPGEFFLWNKWNKTIEQTTFFFRAQKNQENLN